MMPLKEENSRVEHHFDFEPLTTAITIEECLAGCFLAMAGLYLLMNESSTLIAGKLDSRDTI